MRRQFFFLWLLSRRALVALPLAIALVVVSDAAVAQDAGLTDAQRIVRMRDLATQRDEPAVKTAGLGASAATETIAATDTTSPEPLETEPAGVEPEPKKELPANENLPLGGQDSDGGLGLFGGGSAPSGSSSAGGGNWLFNTLAALGIVIALVFAIRWGLRRGGVVTSAAPRGSVVEVLSRSTVAPRSHVVLMRVGQRILVVSDSSAGMRTLASIQDPEEVAELLGAVASSSPTSMTHGFQNVMGKLSSQWSDSDSGVASDADGQPDEDLQMDRTRGALSSLRGRLASMSKAGGAA